MSWGKQQKSIKLYLVTNTDEDDNECCHYILQNKVY